MFAAKKGKLVLFSVIVAALAFTTFWSACAAAPGPSYTSPAVATFEPPEKGNPKLDSRLDQLVQAQARGEAAAFAQQSNIELTDSSVQVVIECAPGRVEAASQLVVAAGGEIETSYQDLLQATVPVTSLTALAGSDDVLLVRLPQRPVPLSNVE